MARRSRRNSTNTQRPPRRRPRSIGRPRPAAPCDRDEERRRAAVLRSGADARLRLQPRRGDPLVPPRRRARPGVADAALGHRAGARTEHQPRRRSRAREGGLRRGAAGEGARGRRAGQRARLRRGARQALFERSEGRSESAGGRLQGRDARRSCASIPTTSTPRRSTPKA